MAFHDATVKIQLDSFLITPAKFLLILIRKGLGPFSKLPVLITATLMFLNVDKIKNAKHRIKLFFLNFVAFLGSNQSRLR